MKLKLVSTTTTAAAAARSREKLKLMVIVIYKGAMDWLGLQLTNTLVNVSEKNAYGKHKKSFNSFYRANIHIIAQINQFAISILTENYKKNTNWGTACTHKSLVTFDLLPFA